MAKRTWTKLSKKDKTHLKESGINTKFQFGLQVEHMKKELNRPPLEQFLCWDCVKIVKKLGMWNGDDE